MHQVTILRVLQVNRPNVIIISFLLRVQYIGSIRFLAGSYSQYFYPIHSQEEA
jgi:hypothetical protein